MDNAFRGNAKRQVELARKRKLRAGVFVRNEPTTVGGIHVSYFDLEPVDQDEVRSVITRALGPEYPFIGSGSNA